MSVSGWKQLAVADAVVTITLIDSCDIISHEVLSPDSNDTINDERVVTLTDAYEKALVDFAFAPVSLFTGTEVYESWRFWEER